MGCWGPYCTRYSAAELVERVVVLGQSSALTADRCRAAKCLSVASHLIYCSSDASVCHRPAVDPVHIWRTTNTTLCLKKVCHFYFHDNFGNSGPILKKKKFAVKFRKDLRRKQELKLSPLLKSVAVVKRQLSTIHLYIHTSENNMPHVRWHLFYEFIFVYFLLILT